MWASVVLPTPDMPKMVTAFWGQSRNCLPDEKCMGVLMPKAWASGNWRFKLTE